jgi:MFS family permease
MRNLPDRHFRPLFRSSWLDAQLVGERDRAEAGHSADNGTDNPIPPGNPKSDVHAWITPGRRLLESPICLDPVRQAVPGGDGYGPATVQITFSLLIVLQTLFSPAQGRLVDRFGPKALGAVGAALTGLGWVLSARVDNVWMLFLTYGLFCGVGTGIRPRQDRVAVAFIRAPLSLHASPRRRDPSAPRPGPG